jgi:hypothetical protein
MRPKANHPVREFFNEYFEKDDITFDNVVAVKQRVGFIVLFVEKGDISFYTDWVQKEGVWECQHDYRNDLTLQQFRKTNVDYFARL